MTLVVVSICDCTGCMVDGRKRDAEFIMEYFSNKVDEFDPKGHLLTAFFDGAASSNCSKSRCYPLCTISKEHVFSWRGTVLSLFLVIWQSR